MYNMHYIIVIYSKCTVVKFDYYYLNIIVAFKHYCGHFVNYTFLYFKPVQFSQISTDGGIFW